ncbi:SixA phosphatase family protein [Pseudozobellia thermophila]|uniref:Broad specificity phosphatase PhoE n=1 Tax=Pseudozobellia thermophila TaxID=192903 RepID=A0A1M6F873_9FLAO|nr:phosphoglycerate mutase family protein [Pseudozobellia thermophila]SHI93846.1 Broad specificity phosphatase PhoE [Pseudozobellia thermophila]
MKRIQLIYIVVFFLCFVGCKDNEKNEVPPTSEPSVSTFYFIRHAEKDRSNPEDPDPELNQSGLGRAMHWAEILDEVELDAIYSTDYQRTSMTAAPTSVKRDIDVIYYEPQTIDVEQFKKDNLNKTVLVVGHSNTTPQFVNHMIGEDKYFEMDDTDNGSLFIVTIVNDIATSQRLHFNCNCPKERD